MKIRDNSYDYSGAASRMINKMSRAVSKIRCAWDRELEFGTLQGKEPQYRY